MGYAHIIATHPILKRLSAEQLDLACRMSREVVYTRNQVIQRQGASESGVHLVIDGYVKLVKTSPDGRELIVGMAGPNDVFGLCCQPVSACPSECTARAKTRTKVITMPTSQWLSLLEHHPDVAHLYMQALSASRSQCIGMISDLVFLRLEARLAKLLHKLTRWSRPAADGAIEVPALFSQGELAAALGSTRVAVTRKIGSLVDAGVLGRKGRRILIRDSAKLKGYFEKSQASAA